MKTANRASRARLRDDDAYTGDDAYAAMCNEAIYAAAYEEPSGRDAVPHRTVRLGPDGRIDFAEENALRREKEAYWARKGREFRNAKEQAWKDAEAARLALRKKVLHAGLQRCAQMGDGDQAIQQMHRDVRDTPDELMADLLAALSQPIARDLFPLLNQPPKEPTP